MGKTLDAKTKKTPLRQQMGDNAEIIIVDKFRSASSKSFHLFIGGRILRAAR
jgi:hypothetical protein